MYILDAYIVLYCIFVGGSGGTTQETLIIFNRDY